MRWEMKCLLCPEPRQPYANLVAIQEHAMDEHGYTQADHQQVQSWVEGEVYTYTFPDGKDWMRAVRQSGDSEKRDQR